MPNNNRISWCDVQQKKNHETTWRCTFCSGDHDRIFFSRLILCDKNRTVSFKFVEYFFVDAKNREKEKKNTMSTWARSFIEIADGQKSSFGSFVTTFFPCYQNHCKAKIIFVLRSKIGKVVVEFVEPIVKLWTAKCPVKCTQFVQQLYFWNASTISKCLEDILKSLSMDFRQRVKWVVIFIWAILSKE